MIRAFPTKDNSYRLEADYSRETFYRKEEIKKFGGHWYAGAWHIPESAIKPLGAHKMIQVKHVAYCHENEGLTWATEAELAAGEKSGMFCSLCDSRMNGKVKIIQL